MEKETITINKTKIKETFQKSFNFIKEKKILTIIAVLLLLFLLIGGSWVRLQNVDLLKDSTTGEYIPLALDPFYFLRIAETLSENGALPAYDAMRYPSSQVGFSNEILPQAVNFLHKVWSVFDSSASIQYIDILSPVIFFALGLLVFFFLIYFLTKSKTVAFVSGFLLAIIPPYLYRTMAGFSDHESIGMFAFFLALLCYTLALRFLDKEKEVKKKLLKNSLMGLLVGLISAFTILSWGGAANFIFLIIPLSFAIIWLIKVKNIPKEEARNKLSKYLVFYFSWFLSSIIFSVLFGYSFSSIISRFVISSSGILGPALFLFLIIDYLLITKGNKLKTSFKKYRILISVVSALVLGILIALIFGQNLISTFGNIFSRLLTPFGESRVGLTVAENAQPYLQDFIGQVGKIFFWLFFGGAIFLGFALSRGIRKKKNKIWFSVLWIIMISGILFSRISQASALNGVSFISKAIYFLSIAAFLIYLIYIYVKDRIYLKNEIILIAVWLFTTLIAVRGAIRFFFVITPVFCFIVGYFLKELYYYVKKSKEDVLKLVLWVLLALAIIGIIISFTNFWKITSQQAKYTGPSAGEQWQKSMEWVRENTQQGEIFVHWWDYGYWVEYLGERPSVTDGGHAVGYWDHLIGRYVLTTPYPETAFSFMKTHEVSYLLIDPSDIGKYPAYSKIGSGVAGEDRYSWISTFFSDPSQIVETKDSVTRFYQGGAPIDQDITYSKNGEQIFLPSEKAIIGGIIIEVTSTSINQPEAIFVYNQKQENIPLRYAYANGQLVDFGSGLEAIAYFFPVVSSTSGQNLNIDNQGAVMYFSPKNMKSLFVQNYILDNAFGTHNNLQLVHVESDPVVKSINDQGARLGEFVYFQGMRGPIKIWKYVDSNNIVEREEFLKESGDYAELDGLQFTR